MSVASTPPKNVETALWFFKKLIPKRLFAALQPGYHYLLANLGALIYRYPSRKLFVIAVTGTKGKTSTVEFINALLEAAGYRTALLSTVHFKINHQSTPNRFKMTVPGRFFVQKFLREALERGCTHVVMEMSSEAAKQYRHRGIEFDALIFTNLAPEHLEAHGGMENYVRAKLSLAKHLETSRKRPRYIVANADDKYGDDFLKAKAEVRAPYSLKDAEPYTADERGARFFWRGELWSSPVPGVFNLKNIIAALTLGEAMGLSREDMKRAVGALGTVPGRAERVARGQKFGVIVDYAHTPDSLRALYETFGPKVPASKLPPPLEGAPAHPRRICILGNTGGGRDTWKRAEMGKIADEFCDVAILTDEDPYDEEPRSIMEQMAKGFTRTTPRIIENRREAIRAAFKEAREGDVVLISGKGTDPYIMRAHGTKEPWSDRKVAEEELERFIPKKRKRPAAPRKSAGKKEKAPAHARKRKSAPTPAL